MSNFEKKCFLQDNNFYTQNNSVELLLQLQFSKVFQDIKLNTEITRRAKMESMYELFIYTN